LKIAARIDAVVLSNDSFQEFHEEYPWLFAEGRLIGGKPVAGVGWVFTPRLPVRGTKSPRSVKKLTVALPPGVKPSIGATITPTKTASSSSTKSPTKLAKAVKSPKKVTAKPAKLPTKTTRIEPTPKSTKTTPVKKSSTKGTESPKVPKSRLAKSPARVATAKPAVAEPAVALRRGRQPVNPEGEFARFVAEHRVRSHVSGEVVAFTSHGAIVAVTVDSGARVECYAPTTLLGNPPPARARDALQRGDQRNFRLVSVDRDRRIAELALL
jgi:hypothetical protein